MTRPHLTPIIGGVLDGGTYTVPAGAEPGFKIRLAAPGANARHQTTDYILHPDKILVASGTKWPIT